MNEKVKELLSDIFLILLTAGIGAMCVYLALGGYVLVLFNTIEIRGWLLAVPLLGMAALMFWAAGVLLMGAVKKRRGQD